MINLMLGSSGSGKSYESVVYHVLPALQKGRRVITNLPLVVEEFEKIDPSFGPLIEFRKRPQPIRGTWTPQADGLPWFELFRNFEPLPRDSEDRVFSNVWDYYTDWKNEAGQGPLFVLDEVQNFLPAKETDKHVKEWYAQHRHANVDVLLITQSYGKISKAVVDNVQMVYRCRKAVAMGFTGRYIRKVQDGVRGEVMNVSAREYQRKFFKLYKSHTKGVAAEELNASDVRPIWRHWSFIGAGLCALFVVWAGFHGWLNPFRSSKNADVAHVSVVKSAPVSASSSPVPVSVPVSAPAPARAVPVSAHPVESKPVQQTESIPFSDVQIHILGYISDGTRHRYFFRTSRNGQGLFDLDADDLKDAGYTLEPIAPCALRLRRGDFDRMIYCDTPRVSVSTLAGDGGAPARGEAPAPARVEPTPLLSTHQPELVPVQ